MNQAILSENSVKGKGTSSLKKILISMLMTVVFVLGFGGTSIVGSFTGSESVAFAAEDKVTKTETYNNGNTKLNGAVKKVIKIVGGVGGLLFTLAILIIAIMIIFGSISAAKMRTVWVSLISCCVGALIFYSAYFLSSVIAGIAN